MAGAAHGDMIFDRDHADEQVRAGFGAGTAFTEVAKPRSTVFQKGILLHLINFLAFKEPI